MTKPAERRDSAPMVEEIFGSISELGSDSRDMALDVEIQSVASYLVIRYSI